jgi:hypothetical protein
MAVLRMRMIKAVSLAGLLSFVVIVASIIPAEATLIADIDAARYTPRSAFGILNCDRPGSISVVTDDARGKVWRFHKPADSNRCEAHGFKVNGSMFQTRNNATYYFGWSSRLSTVVRTNAVFQWKSYGDHAQNFPLVLSTDDGSLTLFNRQPDRQDYTPWRMPITAERWYDIVLGIHTSAAPRGGWVELYIDGVQQTFSNGATRWPCRTWDSHNDPKWGVYGAAGTDIDNDIDNLRIATRPQDVLKPTTATPTPTIAIPTPTIATPTPTIATPAPTIATPTPTIATPRPTIATTRPTTERSTSTIPRPTSTTPRPTATTPRATATTPKPTSTTARNTPTIAKPPASTSAPAIVAYTSPTNSTTLPSLSASEPMPPMDAQGEGERGDPVTANRSAASTGMIATAVLGLGAVLGLIYFIARRIRTRADHYDP